MVAGLQRASPSTSRDKSKILYSINALTLLSLERILARALTFSQYKTFTQFSHLKKPISKQDTEIGLDNKKNVSQREGNACTHTLLSFKAHALQELAPFLKRMVAGFQRASPSTSPDKI
ncbi:hypothetical protein N780_18610 [Pontibacillus chungwhensis BH030062]|uniref:Uncharacterized protein n=1 Tax=Pontibacillus chungwhensis BH030062 TaxID=1385513 RepID=A0A0A2VDL2_9BACI|nr:hypothetical protein N780_18610 [Pontibacillus chungwhensis BH030062]